jgi:hypothetical protein
MSETSIQPFTGIPRSFIEMSDNMWQIALHSDYVAFGKKLPVQSVMY